jgi:DNA-binding response OmpR family regulator
VERRRFDVVVLDVMLPGEDGFHVASELRRAGSFVPVLMLTARGRPEDVLRGFESGADDYLPKPFELTVLLARIRGLLRRREWFNQEAGAAEASAAPESRAEAKRAGASSAAAVGDTFAFGGKTIDFAALELRTAARTLRLTLMEAELLRHLVGRAGQVISRKTLLEEVWGLREDTDTRAIDNFIVRLRKYIEDEPSRPRHLLTVRGVGYRFVPEADGGDRG